MVDQGNYMTASMLQTEYQLVGLTEEGRAGDLLAGLDQKQGANAPPGAHLGMAEDGESSRADWFRNFGFRRW